MFNAEAKTMDAETVAKEVVKMRRCYSCHVLKPMTGFKLNTYGYRTKGCQRCLDAATVARRKKTAQKVKARRAKTRKIVDKAINKEVQERFDKMLAEKKLVAIGKAPAVMPNVEAEAAQIDALKEAAKNKDPIAICVVEISASLAKLIASDAKQKAKAMAAEQ